MIKFLLLLFSFTVLSSANILQESIDKAPAGAILKLPSGIYAGNIVISKPLSIIGKEKNVIIKGEGKGTVITVNSSHVILKNLQIQNSGGRMENLDSGIELHHIKACEVSHCRITNVLYGIDMNMVEDSIISNNIIQSKKNDISLRGDALNAHNNTIENNTFLHNRFGLHLSMSHNNTIKNNTFKYNSVAILLMGVKDINVTGNTILSSKGAAGIAVVADKVSNFHFENNTLKYNAKALYIDTKGAERGKQRFIKNNLISHNGEALHFHASIKNNVITHNTIIGNMDDVVKDTRDGYKGDNIIEYNYWDRYEGFDKNRDNIGDTPHQNFIYADQLWQYDHRVKFFYGTPIMSIINFLAEVAPFIKPVLLLEDTKPLINLQENSTHQ